MIQKVLYEDIRAVMKPGDVIAFSGKGTFSEIIKAKTRSPISHVGIIMRQERDGEEVRNLLIESTSLDGGGGVSTSFLSEVIDRYDGGVYWLPLKEEMTYDQYTEFFAFLLDKNGREYDMKQAVLSAVDRLEVLGLGRNDECFDKLFCSELAAGALEAAGIVPEINASEVTPADLVAWTLYAPTGFQLKGPYEDIERYNLETPRT